MLEHREVLKEHKPINNRAALEGAWQTECQLLVEELDRTRKALRRALREREQAQRECRELLSRFYER